jgi:3-deoxy-manno-octulosonate cytidylyltransferase (CMP-KDO synthetase)
MTTIVLIPARMGAARLPGKPLADIDGEPMILRVLARAQKAAVGPVVVAAGDAAIAEAVGAAGGEAVLTDPGLPSGSDRVLAALKAVDPAGRFDIVLNLQGDMPFVEPAIIQDCIELLRARPSCDIATLVAPEAGLADRTNSGVVKAVLALDDGGRTGRALYFTRSTLFGEGPVWRHVGLYAYRRAALERYSNAPPSDLERREKLEQLRALEIGLAIDATVIAAAPLSVDTPADLAAARAFARSQGPAS